MIRKVSFLLTVSTLTLTVVACGGGNAKSNSMPNGDAAPSITTERSTTSPPPVRGTNGVTVTYTSKTSGTITPRVTKNSETQMPGRHGGALFQLRHDSGLSIWGAVEGDVYPMLHARPGWTITKLSDDPTWTPGACASSPNTVVGDRWIVTAEGTGGSDPASKLDGVYSQYYVRVFDRQTKEFSAITPITVAEPKRWLGPVWAVSPTEVAIVGSTEVAAGQALGTPDVVRIVNLETMTFHDLPYSAKPEPVAIASIETTPNLEATTYRSLVTEKTLRLTKIRSLPVADLGAERAMIRYTNIDPVPSQVADQVGVWDMQSGTWDQAFDSQRPAVRAETPDREASNIYGPGFAVWFIES